MSKLMAIGQGFGTLLMEEAERIAREEHGSIKLAVISGKCLGGESCFPLSLQVMQRGPMLT